LEKKKNKAKVQGFWVECSASLSISLTLLRPSSSRLHDFAYAFEKEKEWYLVKEGRVNHQKLLGIKTKDQKKKKKTRQYLIMCTYLIL
jgi:hypothetical protein